MEALDKIKEYKALLDEGIITEAEFTELKKQVIQQGHSNDVSESVINEDKQNEAYEKAVKKAEEKTSVSYKSAIDDLEKIRGYKDSDTIIEQLKKELPKIEKAESYEKALGLIEKNTVKTHKEALEILGSLEGWKDSDEIIEKCNTELASLQEKEENERQEKKKKRKKVIKTVCIAAVAFLVVLVLISTIIDASKPNLGKLELTKDEEIHSMHFKVPEGAVEDTANGSDSLKEYVIKDNDQIIGIIEVMYKGETDLSGDASYDAESDEHSMTDFAEETIPGCNGLYASIDADNSAFEVTVYCDDENVKGKNTLLDAMKNSFEVDSYKNPRTSNGVTVEYAGDTKEGTVIDSNSEDITVHEEFDTGVAKGTKNCKWSVKEPVTLKADETSELIVIVNGKEYPQKIECSTVSEEKFKSMCQSMDYSDQLRSASYDEHIKIYGQVLQDCGSGLYRISSNGGYDDVYMVQIPRFRKVENSDIVEDDWVTVYGLTGGIYSYSTVLGAEKKIPKIVARYIER